MSSTMASSLWFRGCMPKSAEVRTMATGVNAFSIWMNETVNLGSARGRTRGTYVRYAELLRMSEPENSTPMGKIDLT